MFSRAHTTSLILVALLLDGVAGFSSTPLMKIRSGSGKRNPQPAYAARLSSPLHGSRRSSSLRPLTMSTIEQKFEQTTSTEDEALKKQKFDFTKQWYPMAVIEFLDPKKPHPIELMGKVHYPAQNPHDNSR